MKSSRLLFLLAFGVTSFLHAQVSSRNVATYLDMEGGVANFLPPGWFAGSTADRDNKVVVGDDQAAHAGRFSLRIRRDSATPGTASIGTLGFPMDFGGNTIEVRGWIRTEGVEGAAAIYIREDDSGRNSVAFATTELTAPVTGTTGWVQRSISLPVLRVGATFTVGFVLNGTGTAWADDFQILVDGQPVANAPARPPSILDTDKEFDAGSKITAPASFSGMQVKNLVKLAKVWGFLKYHHPSVVAGERHWDYELIRVLPRVLPAADEGAANAAILSWANSFGPVKQCSPCATLDNTNLYLSPSLDWIADEGALGAPLSQLLRDVYRNRPNTSVQFYAMLNSSQGNPLFLNEQQYPSVGYPDPGFQILALFRTWNMVQYFYPYRDLMSGNPTQAQQYWETALEQAIPRVALAADVAAFKLEMTRFMAAMNDTTSNVSRADLVRPATGNCEVPVELRWAEGKVVVGRNTTTNTNYLPRINLQAGDVIEQLDGVAVAELISRWRPYYGNSNEASLMRDMMRQFTRGSCGETPVEVRRAGATVSVTTRRFNGINAAPWINAHDRAGTATYEQLSSDVAYIKTLGYNFSTGVATPLRSTDIPNYIRQAAGTKGLIIDLRNFNGLPELFGNTFGPAFVSSPTAVAKGLIADPANPGAFRWTETASMSPTDPHYSGKVVILVDELTQGLAEVTAATLRAAPNAVVVGSMTGGAGDFFNSTVPLPGGFTATLSGMGIYKSNGQPIQRTGIVPDVVVAPTVAGIKDGKDEQLEEAIRLITSGAVESPRITLVANAQSEGPTIAPNTWVMIKGSNLAPKASKRIWADADFVAGVMPTQLDGVSVTINGKSAFVYYVSPEQINVLAPTDSIDGQVQVVVTNNGVASNAYAVQAQSISPSFFYVGTGTYILAQHSPDYSLVGPTSMSVPGFPFSPAEPGKAIVLYGNGFGPTSSSTVNGSMTQSGELQPRPTVTIGGVAATVDFAGLISPGLYQLNVTVPASLADGDYPIVATYKGASTQSGLMITVKK